MGCVKVWSVNGGFRVFVKSGLAKKIFIQKDLEIWNICSIFAVEKRGKIPTDWYTKETTFEQHQQSLQSVDDGIITPMSSSQLQHIMSQVRTSIEHDEAMGKLILANAAEKRLLLDAMEEMQRENEDLRANQKVEYTYNIEGDYINQQQIIPLNNERSDE